MCKSNYQNPSIDPPCVLLSIANMEKSVGKSCKDQQRGKDDPLKKKMRSAVASSKVGASRCTSRDKSVGLGDRLDKSQRQSNPTQVSKLPRVPVMKRKLQKSGGVGPSPKVPSVYNLRSKSQTAEHAPSYSLRSKVQKTDDQNASTMIQTRKMPKKDGSKDSLVTIQKRGILNSSSKPVKKIETTKHSTASLAGLDKTNHPSTSQHELFLRVPIYRIRWKDKDVENGPLGQNCTLCNKDLSGAMEDDDSEYDDDFQYDVDDDDGDDLNPPLLPAVDILSCGHVYHTDCLQEVTPKEQSSDPQCILCCKMS